MAPEPHPDAAADRDSRLAAMALAAALPCDVVLYLLLPMARCCSMTRRR